MLFNSLQFLVFFPIVVLAYYVMPAKLKNVWLLLASYYFYMCWSAKYALLMLVSTVVTWGFGLLTAGAGRLAMAKAGAGREKAARWAAAAKKLCVALSFIINLGILFFFKYFNFAAGTLAALAARLGIAFAAPRFNVLLPVGISFYTFQALGYTVDVYRGLKPEKRFLDYALFVSFFPQLVAGPIERTSNLLPQLKSVRRFDYLNVRAGLLQMLWGLFQKLVIADRLAMLVDTVFGDVGSYSFLQIILALVFFALQIYCDFGGYSNIAIGAARVLGVRLMRNFDAPYFAVSIKDFWHRWHVSLSTWFRDYVYIPLGGSRRGKVRTAVNTMITFVLSGLWHGASWHYVAWGAVHGFYQVVGGLTEALREKARAALGLGGKGAGRSVVFRAWNGLYGLWRRAWTFGLTVFAWLFFRADSMGDALLAIKRICIFDLWSLSGGRVYELGLDKADMTVALCALAVLLIVDLAGRRADVVSLVEKQALPLRWLLYLLGIFAIIVFGIYGPQYEAAAFIYFQF